MTRTVFVDFETRSRADIKLLGGLNYVAHPTTDVLALCASDGTRRWCWSPFGLPDRRALGAEVSVSTEPWEIVAATEGARVVAHNAEGFDRPVWEALGLPEREWVDSLPLARRAQLPGKLESLAAYVLGEGKAEAGRKVTLSLSKPIALSAAAIDLAVQAARSYLAGCLLPTGARQLQLLGVWPPSDEALRSLIASPPYGAEVLPTPSPAQLTEVIRYCMQDVELLRRVCEAERLLEPHMDDDALEADRRVNHRGVAVDLALVDRLLTEADAQKARAGARVHAITGGALGEADLRRPARLRAWFAEQGVEVEDCTGPTLFPLLRHADPAVVAVAQARRDVARVVTGKLKAAKLLVSADARLRGSHVYCKAHTWRWASRGVQTQNLPSAPDDLPPDLADRVLAGESLDNADWLGALVRQCFYSPVGLCVVDFAQVEGRATCFLAGDGAGLEVFTSGKDPYCVEASAIFGEPVKKGDKRRQAGKVSVLACLAEGTEVVTDRGFVAIEQVLPSDRLWDGVEWVAHDGLVDRGPRECMNLHGVWLTGDHLVLTEAGWESADTPNLSPVWSSVPCECSGSFENLAEESSQCAAGAPAEASPPLLRTTSTEEPLLGVTPARSSLRRRATGPGPATTVLLATPTFEPPGLDGSARPSTAARTHATQLGPTTAAGASPSTDLGSGIGGSSSATSPPLTAGRTSRSRSTALTTSAATSPGTSAWRRSPSRCGTPAPTEAAAMKRTAPGAVDGSCEPSGDAATAANLARAVLPTFDLANAGPRARFVLSNGLIVHNCGFGGGPGAVERMARKKSIDLGAAGASAAQIVEAWRTAHPAIAGERTGREWTDETGALRFRRRGGAWKACERAFREAFAGPSQSLGFADFERREDDVYVHLPSGRFLRYRDVEVGPFLDRDDTISYYSAEKNKRIPTHAGKLYQNVVQAYCRDLFADAFVRLEVAGYRVVLHEHDAWVIEAPESELAAILAIVRERPTWAADFPLDASGSWARRYAK